MNPRTRRRLVVSLAATGALAGGVLLVGVLAAPRAARDALSRRGCTTSDASLEGFGLRLTEVHCPGGEASEVRIRPLEERAMEITGLHLDLRSLTGAPPEGVPAPAAAAWEGEALRRHVRLADAAVTWGDRTLARGLAGTLDPLDLQGPGVHVRETDAGTEVHATPHLDGPWLSGTLDLTLQVAPETRRMQGTVRAPALTLTHPLLGRSVPDLVVRGTFEAIPDAPVRVEADLEVSGISLHLHAEGAPPEVVEVTVPDTSLERLLAPLLPLVPEAEDATLRGHLGGRVLWRRDGVPEVEIRSDRLVVTGAIPPAVELRGGPFTYPARQPDGSLAPRLSGEGTPGWTPLDEISPHLVHALLAAEDVAFRTHSGWDPAATREALLADLAEGGPARGGSTLTQQLAKNLFLDGSPTLQRKLRELLLAVELDARLGKDRVLELYLNVVEWGPAVHGAGAACDLYFLKRPAALLPEEAAWMVLLLPSPVRHHRDWYVGERTPRTRLETLLQNMADAGWLAPEEARAAAARPIRLVPPPPKEPLPDP